MQTLKIKSDTYKLRQLVRQNLPHTVERTKSTTKIITEKQDGSKIRYLFADSDLDISDLGFIRSVKTCALKSRTAPEGNTSKNISYFRFKDLAEGTYKGVCEVDANSAYWEIARRRGIITRDVYEKGKRVSKKTRLVSLGALATQKTYWEYDPVKQKYKALRPEISDDQARLRSYFFDVAKELDEYMSEGHHDPAVLFYWVDAFFLEASHADQIAQRLNNWGLGVKLKNIDRVEVGRLASGRMVANVYDPPPPGHVDDPSPRPFHWGGAEETAEYIIKCMVGTLKGIH